jgi:hypothetical protein
VQYARNICHSLQKQQLIVKETQCYATRSRPSSQSFKNKQYYQQQQQQQQQQQEEKNIPPSLESKEIENELDNTSLGVRRCQCLTPPTDTSMSAAAKLPLTLNRMSLSARCSGCGTPILASVSLLLLLLLLLLLSSSFVVLSLLSLLLLSSSSLLL